MKSYTHFTLSERKYLQKLLSEDKSFREIARILERSPSSISREVNRNKAKYRPKHGSDNRYWYNHWRANIQYIYRRRIQQRRAIIEGSKAWEYVMTGISQYWSPEEVCERWHLDCPDAKKLYPSTIYRYIKNGELPHISPKTHLRRRGKNKNYVHHNTAAVHADKTVLERPKIIDDRSRLGDWEGDTVYGGTGKGLILTMVDRKSRLLKMALLSSRNTALTSQAIINTMHGLPVQSITFDNGTEFADYHTVEKALKTTVYFTEPHKPWQRGTNENTNGLIRFFFPKGFDFRTITADDLQFVEDLINNRPRKCLGWKTPNEVFFDKCVALA